MIAFFCRKAVRDILDHTFLNTITVITMALAILIVSAFMLFFINAGDIMHEWQRGMRIMAYLQADLTPKAVPRIEEKLQSFYGVQEARFIPKAEALAWLRSQMPRQASIFENLKENPLPDAFEIRMVPEARDMASVEALAAQIEALPWIEGVEYGQKWLGRFVGIYNLFKLAGYALGTLFLMASVFIVANTIRLVLYARREEVEIMRLVGATDAFIKAPFFIEGLILGGLSGVLGILVLLLVFFAVAANFHQDAAVSALVLRFLPLPIVVGIVAASMLVGLLGCWLSLNQFMKR